MTKKPFNNISEFLIIAILIMLLIELIIVLRSVWLGLTPFGIRLFITLFVLIVVSVYGVKIIEYKGTDKD
ncbi:hypothetical protein [Aquimarina algiphila]|uniref:Uncharacterized protein n=1 Tax=Aquimarina algiphila TaxID=2047982 RepID=A0A554VE23_9FLAO|nr:hypothetical protein [Aquimarina algiphila]TSE05239.1 hypothetical protein FOF46_23535 [Aquimarina algiphila]